MITPFSFLKSAIASRACFFQGPSLYPQICWGSLILRTWIGLYLIFVILSFYGCSRLNNFQKDGELQLTGLKAPVKVMRDEKGNSVWFDDIDTADIKESRDDLFYKAAMAAATDLESSLGKNPEKWLWGKVHRIEFVSPIRREGFGKGLVGGGSHPALGSGETLGRGIYGFNDPFDVRVIASLRMVADLADPDKVLAVLPGGVSGRLFGSHTKDQIESFMNGNKVYWWLSDAAIEAHCRNTLVLKP